MSQPSADPSPSAAPAVNPPSASEGGLSARLEALWAKATPLRLALLATLPILAYQLLSLDHYAMTSDSGALFYAGDRTLFWLHHLGMPGALDLLAKQDPPGFHTVFGRYPDFFDPVHYPVLPGFLGALASALFHDRLGIWDVIAAHHAGLVLFNAVGLVLFCLYACALLGRGAGFLATVACALYPSAAGHTMNNAKDWPCALFYGITLLAAGVGVVKQKPRHLLEAGALLGISMACKANAAFILPTLFLWFVAAFFLLRYWRSPVKGKVGLAILAAPFIGFVLFVLLWPWLWYGKPSEWWDHTYEYYRFMRDYGLGKRLTWTNYPLRALFFMTPPVVLVTAAWALFVPKRDRDYLAVWSLCALWFLIPIVRIAAPKSNFYDANRHFLEYIPGLACLAALGLMDLARRLSRLVKSPAVALVPAASGALFLGAVVAPIVEYHPWQIMYFNAFIGGLGGAQQKGLFFMPAPPSDARVSGTEGDYWSSSIRDAVRDAEKIAGPGTPVGVCHFPALAKANFPEGTKIQIKDWWEPEYHKGPYMLVTPRETACWWREIHEFEAARPVIKRVERGGGLVYEILGPKDGKEHPLVSKHSWYEDHVAPGDGIGQRKVEAEKHLSGEGQKVVEQISDEGVITYDVVDAAGNTVWHMPVPRRGW